MRLTVGAPLGSVFTLINTFGIKSKTEILTGGPLTPAAVFELDNPLAELEPVEALVIFGRTLALVNGQSIISVALMTPTADPTGIATIDALPPGRFVYLCDPQSSPPGSRVNLSFSIGRVPPPA